MRERWHVLDQGGAGGGDGCRRRSLARAIYRPTMVVPAVRYFLPRASHSLTLCTCSRLRRFATVCPYPCALVGAQSSAMAVRVGRGCAAACQGCGSERKRGRQGRQWGQEALGEHPHAYPLEAGRDGGGVDEAVVMTRFSRRWQVVGDGIDMPGPCASEGRGGARVGLSHGVHASEREATTRSPAGSSRGRGGRGKGVGCYDPSREEGWGCFSLLYK